MKRVIVTGAGGSPAIGFVRSLRTAPEPFYLIGLDVNPYNLQLAPTTVDCPSKTLLQVADASGTATFRALIGGAENSSSITVRANGVPLSLIQARSTDMDANGDTGLNDLLLFGLNFFGNPAALESDFDNAGGTGLNDLLLFGLEFFSGGSGVPCI